jgi:hypothetical protein
MGNVSGFYTACDRWKEIMGGDDLDFWRWLSDGENVRTGYMLAHYTDKELNRLELLAGPNGYTLLKMLKAQRDAENGTSQAHVAPSTCVI